jgi:hypothetical protein
MITQLCRVFIYASRICQSHIVENNVKTRWPDNHPARDWVRNFRRRWKHRVKVHKPTNIKRAWAKVSSENVRAFIERLTPNMEAMKAYNVFNYDESTFRDDPVVEDAFFPENTRHCEKVQNHSKMAFSVMFCCRLVKFHHKRYS